MTDAMTTSDTKKTHSPDHHNTGCAHTTGLPLLSAMSPEQLEEAWTTGLRTKGRRVTKQRLAVLHAVQEHPHSTADTTTPSAYAAARSKTWTARLAPHPA